MTEILCSAKSGRGKSAVGSNCQWSQPGFYLILGPGWHSWHHRRTACCAPYLTRLAIAKSNIFENHKRETAYIFREEDGEGRRLSGKQAYTLTFPKGQTPPVSGFWALTMYDKLHFFAPNEIKRYSTGTKNQDLKFNADGSLTLFIQHQKPAADKAGNWLPAPAEEFAMSIRAYGPVEAIIHGEWTPPPLVLGKPQ